METEVGKELISEIDKFWRRKYHYAIEETISDA